MERVGIIAVGSIGFLSTSDSYHFILNACVCASALMIVETVTTLQAVDKRGLLRLKLPNGLSLTDTAEV